MDSLLISLLTLGMVDMFTPDGIAMIVVLLPAVKKRWHALLYAIAAYVAYLLAGIGIFFGVDVFLKDFYEHLCVTYPREVAIGKLVIGFICLIGCILMVGYLVRSAVRRKELSMTDMLMVRSVSPWFIVLLAFGSTWSQLFTFVPMIAFIGNMVMQGATFLTATLWLTVFCAFSLVPPLAVYILYACVKGERFQKIMSIISKVMTYFCFYCIPILLGLGAWWGLSQAGQYFGWFL